MVTLHQLAQPSTYTGTATGISIQCNTLANQDVLATIMQAVVEAQDQELPMAEMLILALEAGSAAGGDKRCGE
nr:DUF1028 domain-containing protein [Spirosoma sp. KNUC1025]